VQFYTLTVASGFLSACPDFLARGLVQLIADDLGQDVEHLTDERIDGAILDVAAAALT